ncbi:MAG: XAC2610-related protein [Parafilimonas sp.]
MAMKFFLALLIFTLTDCTNNGQQYISVQDGSSKKLEKTPDKEESFGKTEIVCDTVYKNKGYKITLTLFDTANEGEATPNTLFTFSKQTNKEYVPFFSDSIFNNVQEVHFADFNNDGIKDILVQNISDVRINWTYYLYLVDTLQNKLKKIKGFEEIKNPNYLPQYNLIDNYVMSGQNWTSFYKIEDDSIKDFKIIIYDNQTKDGSYRRGHEKAIQSILTKEKTTTTNN